MSYNVRIQGGHPHRDQLSFPPFSSQLAKIIAPRGVNFSLIIQKSCMVIAYCNVYYVLVAKLANGVGFR